MIAGRLASGWARREIRFGLYIMSLRTVIFGSGISYGPTLAAIE